MYVNHPNNDNFLYPVCGSELYIMVVTERPGKYSGSDIYAVCRQCRLTWTWFREYEGRCHKKEIFHLKETASLQKAEPKETGANSGNCGAKSLFMEPRECPECKQPQRIMRTTEYENGDRDIVGHCPCCLQDWQWRCDVHGRYSEMRPFFHG